MSQWLILIILAVGAGGFLWRPLLAEARCG